MKCALIDEREKILREEPGYGILGCEFVLSTLCISQICEKPPFITSEEELHDLQTLRPEYHDRIYRLVCDTLTCDLSAPSQQQKCIYTL